MTENLVILIGRVGQKPDIVSFNDGGKIAKVSLATSDTWKDKQGEKHEQTEWHNIVVRGNAADFVEKYVDKGYELYIKGSLRTRKYESKGETRYVTEIQTTDVQVIHRPQNNVDRPSDQPVQQAKGRPQSRPVEAYDNGSNDLPF